MRVGYFPRLSSILEVLKERVYGSRELRQYISRLEAACTRFRPSLFGYDRAEAEGLRQAAVTALAAKEAGRDASAPDASLGRNVFGVSPREVGEFMTRVEATLARSD